VTAVECAEPTDGSQQPREPTRRLFFALWPDEALQRALIHATGNAVGACGGRPVPSESLHVTLVFVGSVLERRIPELMRIGGQLASAFPRDAVPLQLTFDHIEHWKKAQIICALARNESAGAIALAETLKNELVRQGFSPDLKPFRAHVTLARKVPRGSHDYTMQSVLWSFTGCALVESRTGPSGSLYSILGSWPLCTEVR
jgi:2'-5' RNA ligase